LAVEQDEALLAAPPGLEELSGTIAPPPGLSLLGAEEEDSAEVAQERPAAEVRITGLPNKLLSGMMLQVVFEEAGLHDVVSSTPTCGHLVGAVVVAFSTLASAERCVRHFAGCQWDASGATVTAELQTFEEPEAAFCEPLEEVVEDFYGDDTCAQLAALQVLEQACLEQSCLEWGLSAHLAAANVAAWCGDYAEGGWGAQETAPMSGSAAEWFPKGCDVTPDLARHLQNAAGHLATATSAAASGSKWQDPAFVGTKTKSKTLAAADRHATEPLWLPTLVASEASTEVGESEAEEAVEAMREPIFVHVA